MDEDIFLDDFTLKEVSDTLQVPIDIVKSSGQDLMKQLNDQPLGSRLLIPCNMLKMDEDIFLDDFTLKEVSDTLQVPIDIVKSSGQDLIDAILGVVGPNPTDTDENQMKDRRITTA